MISFPDSSSVRAQDTLPGEFLARVAAEYSPPEQLARTRASWYGMLAGVCHAPPPPAVLEAIASGMLVEQVSSLLGADVAEPWRALAPAPNPIAIRQDFQALFRVPGPRYLTPNESVWADSTDIEGNPRPKKLLMGPSTLDTIRRWKRIGHEIERSSGELADYIGLELHLLEQLCVLEADAWERQRPEVVRFLLDQQRAFIDDHLGRWLEPLCERMGKNARDPFYRGVARVMPTYVAMDRATLGSLLQA